MGPSDGIVLRDARMSDADAMHAMIVALADFTGDAHRVTGTAADMRRYGFGDERLFDCVIAERGSRPVGLCLYFYTFSTWLGEPGVYVQDIFVDAAERGSGLGGRLLAAVASRGAGRAATHLRLSVDTDNRVAREFYARVGMTHRQREETYHLGGEAFTRLAESGP